MGDGNHAHHTPPTGMCAPNCCSAVRALCCACLCLRSSSPLFALSVTARLRTARQHCDWQAFSLMLPCPATSLCDVGCRWWARPSGVLRTRRGSAAASWWVGRVGVGGAVLGSGPASCCRLQDRLMCMQRKREEALLPSINLGCAQFLLSCRSMCFALLPPPPLLRW